MMKGKKQLLIGLIFGVVIGWMLGFLRLPYIEKNYSFLLGFIAALVFIALSLLLLTVWDGDFLHGIISKKTANRSSNSTRTYTYARIIMVGILVLGGVLVYNRNKSFQLKIQDQQNELQELKVLATSVQKNDLKPLLTSLLEDISKELNQNPRRTLSDTTLNRIVALSFAFKPYKYINGDSLSKQESSPERGQLLQALVLMNIDTGTFGRIKRSVPFAWADLRAADLKGLDLSGINLANANLKNADMSGINLKGADLKEANLWGANLNQANLRNVDLKKADLRWVQLNEAHLTLANLSGANLSNAQLRKADLTGATARWTQLVGILFNEAILTSVDFGGSNFTKANLKQATLIDADIRTIDFSGANFEGVRLENAWVNKNWPEKLKEWQPVGLKALQENYTAVNDTIDRSKRPLYRLKKN
ncbi:MAG: hypothetical protein RIR11_2155 [Bacteroidota bacterium]|jgi:uncharacterized protein YjbI with pentapeptide repeats